MMVFLFGASAFGAAASHASKLVLPPECQELLRGSGPDTRHLNSHHRRLVFDVQQVEPIAGLARPFYKGNVTLAEDPDRLPATDLSRNGQFVATAVIEKQTDFVCMSVRQTSSKKPFSEVSVPRDRWRGRVVVSPSGRHLVLVGSRGVGARLIDARTGRILLDVVNSVAFSFAPAGNEWIVNRQGTVQRYKLSADAVHLDGSYPIDSKRAVGSQPFLNNTLQGVQVFTRRQAIVGFYRGMPPVLIQTHGMSGYMPKLFQEAPTGWYEGDGLVTGDEKTLLVVRREAQKTYMEIFDTVGVKHVRSLPLLPEKVTATAVSPSGRFLAVTQAAFNMTLIFDLEAPGSGPWATIQTELWDGAHLAFASEHELIAGSQKLGVYYKWMIDGKN